jgi:acetylornithine/succinyldiaminopimelate/putrescine aminotransferase
VACSRARSFWANGSAGEHGSGWNDSKPSGIAEAWGCCSGCDWHPASRVAAAALRGGVFVLAEGENAESLAITPPAVITEEQLDQAMDIIESAIAVGA